MVSNKTRTKRQGSGKQYRILFESNPQPMWVYDLGTLSFLAVNDAAIYHYGYSREEFLSMTIKDIRPTEDVPALLDNVSKVTSGLDAAGAWRHRKKDGSIIFVEITSHTMTFKGHISEVVLANNVTERRRAEERLAKLTECFLDFGTDPLSNINRLTAVCGELMGAATALYNRLDRGMLCTLGQWNIPPDFKTVDKPEGHICNDIISQSNIQDGLFIIQDFKIEFANEAFAMMAGYTEEDEVIGKDFREFIAPEDLGLVTDYYRRRLKGETVPKEYEFNAVHKNGKTRVTVNINVGLMNYRGRVAIIGTLKDITERKRADEMQKENPYTGKRERVMDIIKMRNTKTTVQLLSYNINSKGIEISTSVDI